MEGGIERLDEDHMHTWTRGHFPRKQYLVQGFPFLLVTVSSPLLLQLVADVGWYLLFVVMTVFYMCPWDKFGKYIACQRTGPGLWVTYLSRATVGNPGSMQALCLLVALYLDGLCAAYGHIKRGGIFFEWEVVLWFRFGDFSVIYTCNQSTGCLLSNHVEQDSGHSSRLPSRAWGMYCRW